MKLEDIEDLLRDNKIEEAYSEASKLYNEHNDYGALYYMCIIDLNYHENADLDNIRSNFLKILNCKNETIRKFAYFPFLATCISQEDYEDCYKYGKKAIDDGITSHVGYLAYALGLFYLKNDLGALTEDMILKALECDDVEYNEQQFMYELLTHYYVAKKDKVACDNVITKLYLIYSSDPFTKYVDITTELEFTGTFDDERLEDLKTDENYYIDTLDVISDYYYKKDEYEKCLQYTKMLVEVKDDYAYNRRLALAYLLVNDGNKCIEVLKKESLNENADANYLIGSAYLDSYFGSDALLAIPYFEKAYLLDNNIFHLKGLALACINSYSFDKYENYAKILREKFPNNKYSDIQDTMLYEAKCNYDKAMKSLAKAKKHISKAELANHIYKSSSKPNKSYKYFKSILNEDDTLFFTLRANYYGEYGMPINLDEVNRLLPKALKLDRYNCLDSLIGISLLDKEPNKAYEYFEAGANRFFEHKHYCTCSLAFMCNSLLHGIGVEKNVEKAYSLAKKAIELEGYSVSENLGNVYAECAILLNCDLAEVLEFLKHTFERRYSISRYFMIIKLSKLLNIECKNYERLYLKSFKYASKRENDYYKNNPTFCMLNNY